MSAYLPPAAVGATALDVAAGAGRHLRLAHERGYAVTGVDRSIEALAHLRGTPGITVCEYDLENGQAWAFTERTFQAVIVTNYLHRPILPALVASVASDGVLIYETFGAGNERFGRPANPDFLLQPGELLAAVQHRLTPIAYQHTTLINPTRIVQRMVAVGANHPWLADPPSSELGR